MQRPSQRPPLPAGEGWGEGENQETPTNPISRLTIPSTQPTESHQSSNPTNQSNVTPYSDTGSDNEEEIPYDEINRIIDDAIDRIRPPHGRAGHRPRLTRHTDATSLPTTKHGRTPRSGSRSGRTPSIPEEYEAIINDKATEFDAQLETRLERRKHITVEREQREKQEAERLAEQREAEAEAADEEPEEPGPPTRSQHKPKLLFTLGNSMYIDCEHPDCDLHDEDRNRWKGSVQYGAGPTRGGFP